MSRLRGIFPISIHGLWVSQETLGVTADFVRNGLPVRVDLPRDPDEFRTWESLPGDWYEAVGSPATSVGGSMEPHSKWDFVSVQVIRITVDFASAVGASDFDSPEHASEAYRAVKDDIDNAAAVARTVPADVVAWARAGWGQSWLGLSNAETELAGPTTIIERDTGLRLPVGASVQLKLTLRDVSEAIGPSDLEELIAAVAEEREAPLPESFLADAAFLAWEHPPVDPVRAALWPRLQRN